MKLIVVVMFVICLLLIPLSLSSSNVITKGIVRINGHVFGVVVVYVSSNPFVFAKINDNVYMLMSMDSYVCSGNSCERLGNVLTVMRQL